MNTIKRKIISKFTDWKNKPQKVALLVCGARQVGKTTTIRQFGRQHYKHFVEINFEQTPEAKQAFDGNRDADSIINRLSVMGYGPFVEKQTLIFFDEILSCPNARTAIKFLVEDGRFDYIESGSLLGINYADVSSYPVGFEQQIKMFPLDFEEWLWANGVSENVIDAVRKSYTSETPVDDFLHEQLMKHYRAFLIVGGMPKVAATYLANPDFAETLNQQKIIIDSYRLDIAKYAASQKTKAKLFFDAIPSQLAKEKKRFVLSDLEKTASMQKYEDAAQWLSDAGVAIFSFNTHALELPFEQYENRNLFKVYMLDTGLLCNMWGTDVQWQVLQGNLDINEGALTENFVAAELTKHGRQLHYYDLKSRNELDFLLQEGNRLSVLEVKSGKDYKRHTSLTKALASPLAKIGRSVVLNKFNVEKTDQITYLPLYMAAFM